MHPMGLQSEAVAVECCCETRRWDYLAHPCSCDHWCPVVLQPVKAKYSYLSTAKLQEGKHKQAHRQTNSDTETGTARGLVRLLLPARIGHQPGTYTEDLLPRQPPVAIYSSPMLQRTGTLAVATHNAVSMTLSNTLLHKASFKIADGVHLCVKKVGYLSLDIRDLDEIESSVVSATPVLRCKHVVSCGAQSRVCA